MAKLEVRHLSISFRTNNGAVRAVRDISFSLNEGETLAIAGESGSGKSVTTRAIMGILAPSAMVDSGEIIYDGRDLLKIPEEEFHTLRGHRLSMVFQDPLSALNPIMRIGRQLTEAMLLNNKERRADGKKRFNTMLKALQERMTAAGVTDAAQLTDTFDKFTAVAVKEDFAYREAMEAAVEADDCLDEINEALLQKNARPIRDAADRLKKALKKASSPWMPAITALPAQGESCVKLAKHYRVEDSEALTKACAELHESLKRLSAGTEPDFFSVGYAMHTGHAPQPSGERVEAINAECRERLETEFLNKFIAAVAAAMEKSAADAAKARESATEALRRELPVFSGALNEKEVRAALGRAADAVQAAIDPLQLQKDNLSYIYRGSMTTYLNRCLLARKQNPKEEQRFARDTVRREKLVAKGKFAPSVVPKNLIDDEAAHAGLAETTQALIDHYAALRNAEKPDYTAAAVEMVAYLREAASDYAFRLSKGMARHRAIELMREVGIPQPHRRFTQYPFEFSGGMRQRIVIAIALSANPDILICDEPTTALDVTIQAQILELINRLKRERRLSVIFITHDLGVVANMADKIAIMYAGKIVEYGTADDIFYDPRHPYTWALLSSMPDLETTGKLEAIPGTPPDMILPPKGDAFAARNKYAMEIDFERQPPMFRVSDTHSAATWLLHPDAPKVDPPAIVLDRIERMKKEQAEWEAAHAKEVAQP